MRDIVLAAVILVLLVWTLRSPWVGVLTWTWLGLMNPHRLSWGFIVDAPVAAAVAAVTLLSMVLHAKENRAPPPTAPVVWLTLLTLHFNFTTLFAWTPEAAWFQWDKVMKILLFTYVTMLLIHGRERIQWLMIVVAGSLAFYGIKGGLFSLTTGGQYKVWGPDGTFIDGNNEIGLAMIMVWPLMMALARDPQKWVRWLFKAGSWLTPLSIIFTYSRGALLGFAAVSVPLVWHAKRKWLLLVMAIPVGAFVLWFTPEQLVDRAETIQTFQQDHSAMQRIQAWGVCWNVAVARPFTGAGFQLDHADAERWLSHAFFLSEEWGNRPRAAHSIYFQILGDHGFLGLALFLGLLVSTFTALSRVRKAALALPDAAWLAEYANALRLGLIGYAVSGAFLSLAYFDLFYIFVAATAIMQRELARMAKAVPAGPPLAGVPARRGAAG